jgi:hypothetical protein
LILAIGVGGSKARGEKTKNVPNYLLFINPTVCQKKKSLRIYEPEITYKPPKIKDAERIR